MDDSATQACTRWRFENVEFDEARGELHVDGHLVPVEPRPLQLLAELLRHRGRVLSKEDLLASVWQGRPTVEHVLPSAVNRLRKALGPQASTRIVTLPRLGYRFTGSVQCVVPAAQPAAPPAPKAADATAGAHGDAASLTGRVDALRQDEPPALPSSRAPDTAAAVGSALAFTATAQAGASADAVGQPDRSFGVLRRRPATLAAAVILLIILGFIVKHFL